MPRFVKKQSHKTGLAPGSLVMVGEPKEAAPRIRRFDFDARRVEERDLAAADLDLPPEAPPTVTWVNIDGLHDMDIIARIGRRFGIHPLTLEDVVNTGHRPKFDDLEEQLFIVFKMLDFDPQTDHIRSEQVSLVCGDGYVVSFQEAEGDVFEPVRSRIRKGRGRIRTAGSSYLAYALMDAAVDRYFSVLETIGERIEDLEREVLSEPDRETVNRIHELKRELIYCRKQVWPMREMVGMVLRSDSDLIRDDLKMFLSDLQDHAVQAVDTLESFRDMLTGLMDLYLSTMSQRMNEVMKVLTLIATIFIPLTFIAGIYGMNFKYMPELEWRWAYFGVLALMAVLGIGMAAVFKYRKWL